MIKWLKYNWLIFEWIAKSLKEYTVIELWPKGLASFLTNTRKSKKKADISCISLANNRLMDVAQLALNWVGWPNSEKLALTCVQIWSRPKSSQASASARKAWPNGVTSRPKFSTCVYLRLCLAKALRFGFIFFHTHDPLKRVINFCHVIIINYACFA